jgi:hypothetical protein
MMIAKLVQRIREEFDEAPGLAVTVDEGARFWALEPDTCRHVLAELQSMNVLVRTEDGRYRRAHSA